MTISILRTADAWWVKTATGAAKIATSATTTRELLADRAAIDAACSVHGFPQANMFDQPDFEALLRANLKRYPHAELRGNAEVTDIADDGQDRVRVTFADRADNQEHVVDADYVLGCDGANSLVRARIGATMRDLRFEQRWLIVDIATRADLGQWDGVHQICDPVRAGTYMRISDSRYRWEFRLLPRETAADFGSLVDLRPLIAPWVTNVVAEELELIRWQNTPFVRTSPTGGAAATSFCSTTPPT